MTQVDVDTIKSDEELGEYHFLTREEIMIGFEIIQDYPYTDEYDEW